MQTYFANETPEKPTPQSLLSPAERHDLIERFATTSAAFCATRGYAPDLTVLRAQIVSKPWTKPEAIPIEHIAALLDVGAQIAGGTSKPQVRTIPKPPAKNKTRYSITIRPRPWLVHFLDRMLRTT